MSLSSAKAKLDAQGGDPVTGYISKTDHKESYDELLDDTALTGATTAEAVEVTGTTDASSSTTGTLKTAGGLGVAKKAYVGTDLAVGGAVAVTGAVTSAGITSSAAVQAAATSGFVSGASGPMFGLTGSGTPEGTVTAPVGSEYTDTTTALAYRKATGTGNAGWALDPTAWLVNTTSGRWLMPQVGTASNLTMTPDGDMLHMPFPVYRTMTVDRIGLNHAVAGSAGALWRLGIYRIDTTTTTASLVLDAGTIDATQSAGLYSVTCSQQLTPGLYTFAVATQGAAGTKPQLKVAQGVPSPMGLAIGAASQNAAFNTYSLSFLSNGATGALPASPSIAQFGYFPYLQVRVA